MSRFQSIGFVIVLAALCTGIVLFLIKIEILQNDNVVLTQSNDRLRSSVMTLQNKLIHKPIENTNVQDIENYIRKYYTLVPKEVANAIARCVDHYGTEYKLPVSLITAMIEQESMFNPCLLFS